MNWNLAEQTNLLKSVVATGNALYSLRATAGNAITQQLRGLEPAEEIIKEWKELISHAEEVEQLGSNVLPGRVWIGLLMKRRSFWKRNEVTLRAPFFRLEHRN